ncbi:hypothetical protein [Paenibacillus sp. HB172176]|uniref:hypothetical protein n=1 Tax=Paenibacillus sp. HB172176 TaxID=2493690 RepID=UPI00143881BD|nr:hypothetical protein [Paenibacillus sp. HB172176]
MIILLTAGLLIGGAIIWILRKWMIWTRMICDLAAVATYIVFGVKAADAVMQTVEDGTVFMTEVHRVFLSHLFLVCGAYVGTYGLAFLLERLTGTRTEV